MPPYRVEWTGPAKTQFGELRRRAIIAGKHEPFRHAHREMMFDLEWQPEGTGALCYRTRASPPGEVRYSIREFIAITFVLWKTADRVVILEYSSVPESWPFGETE